MFARLLDRLGQWVKCEPNFAGMWDIEQLCGFLGCENPVPGDYEWQMCDSCYDDAD